MYAHSGYNVPYIYNGMEKDMWQTYTAYERTRCIQILDTIIMAQIFIIQFSFNYMGVLSDQIKNIKIQILQQLVFIDNKIGGKYGKEQEQIKIKFKLCKAGGGGKQGS